MIQANELRIGNLVYDCDRVYMIYSGFEIGNKHNDNKFEPIPLTEEWLIRMGFEKYGHGFKEHWYLNDFEIEIHGDKFVLRIDGGESAPHLTQYLAHHTKSVHQLQNLYFALTGQEL